METGKYSLGGNETTLPSPDIDAALEDIQQTLELMLMLAQVSASNLEVDRATLQKTLERLQAKIDRIADSLPGM